MSRNVTVIAVMSLSILLGRSTSADDPPARGASELLAVMAEGIGDLTYASPEWVEAQGEALSAAAARHADGLKDLGQFTFCGVAHNAPAYLHSSASIAWHIKFDGATVEARTGELPADECDFKIQADHSILSNLAHVQSHGNDPVIVAAAQARLAKLTRWKVDGKMSEHKVLQAVLRSVHDTMAARTMPRFVFMTPEWVSTARHIVSTRARMPEMVDGIKDVEFKFSEVFIDPPGYAFPDGSPGGFWVHCSHGEVTVGAGPLPQGLEPADSLLEALYTPVVPVGRTVNAAMTEDEKKEQRAYSRAAFAPDKDTKRTKGKTSPTGRPFPPGLGRVMGVLHDELSKRTSGELPSDFDKSIKAKWATPQKFDRHPDYDASWTLYDQFDIYGEPRKSLSAGVYELRTYTASEGKLDNVSARLRATTGLLAKHGMQPVGYWLPTDEPKSKNTVIYILKHASRDAAKASWGAFGADPEWRAIAKESRQDGRILAKAPDSVFMSATDYSPHYSSDNEGDDAVFELRTYRTNEGKLENLGARFRDHTIRIFHRFGMRSVAYWHPIDEPDSKDTLIYIIRHDSRDAAKASWRSFGGDEEWRKVAKESQKDGPFLRERPESIYMKATDYSAIR